MRKRSRKIDSVVVWRFFMPIIFLNICNPDLVSSRINKSATGEVSIQYEPSLKNAAQETAALYQKSKVALEGILGWKYPGKPTIFLVKNNNDFKNITGYDYIVALAIPQKNLIIIDYSKMGNRPFSLTKTMKHELCHLMLHDHIRNERLPKWLDEGIAQWVSDGMAELIMNSKRQSLDDVVLAGNYLPFADLTHRFPRDRQSLWLAYEESKSMVEYIVKRYGKKGVSNLLYQLKTGQDFDTALDKCFSITFAELESGWRRQVKKDTRLFVFMANYMYELLFVLAAILTIAGFIRFMLKKKAYKDEEEDELMPPR